MKYETTAKMKAVSILCFLKKSLNEKNTVKSIGVKNSKPTPGLNNKPE